MVGDLIALLSPKGQDREDESSSSTTRIQNGSLRYDGGSSSASATSTITLNLVLDDLGDDELIQIFVRLPDAKFAFGVSLVSKRWYSLISHPCFVSQFITHHIKRYPNPYIVFISSYRNYQLFRLTDDDESIFESRGYALEFLPEEREFIKVVASCNDLLYCRVIKSGIFPHKYYICNPLTMQWFLLPPRPQRVTSGEICFGLVCEPNYQRWKQGQEYDCRFRVVHIVSKDYKRIFVGTYCSETGQWNEILLLGGQYMPRSNVVAHDGKLHWFQGPGVVVYDPFNNNVQSIIVDGFDSGLPGLDWYFSASVGVCHGMAWFMHLVKYRGAIDNDILSVWELEDYASGRLSLKHRIFFNRGNLSAQRFAGGLSVRPLGFHPNIKDVVYLDDCKTIYTCKIEGGELKIIGTNLKRSLNYRTRDVLTTVIPRWPTLLPQKSHDRNK